MANVYTSVYQVLNDLDLFSRIGQGQDFFLGNFQSLAQNRWTWIVENWGKSLRERFKAAIKGDQDLDRKFDDFQRYIDSWNLGNRNNPFSTIANFLNVIPFLNIIALKEMKLSPDEIALREKEKDRVSNLSIEDIQAMISFLRKEQALRAQALGLGDDDAAKVTGIGTGIKQRAATIDDLEQIEELDQIIKYALTLIVNLQQTSGRQPNVLALTQQNLSSNSSIKFVTNYQSAVPVPFEISLQHMAKKFLGRSDLWFELVTINNLQPPFVDESGSKFPLLAPAAVNNLIIADTRKTDIGVGTKIKIGSYKFAEESRIIEKLIFNDNGTMVLFLSGAQDLNKFKPGEKAFVRIYDPQTTRQGEFVLIPRTQASPSKSGKTPESDELRRLDKALLDFGVDIFVNDENDDFAFDANGNIKVAAGFTNVKQAALNALKTVRGELAFHPGYGVNADIGGRFYGTTDEALIFGEILRETLLKDKRFTQVLISNVSTTGTGISISLIVQIAGSNQPIPLNFIS